MKSNTFLIILVALAIVSCGPSEQEIKQREQFVADSIKVVKETQRIHQEKIEVGKSMKKTWLNEKLEIAKKQIEKEKKEYNSINEFQFGRSLSTKENQLNRQKQIIDDLESVKGSIEAEIAKSELFNSFDFQSTPEGTIAHLFEAAKNRSFDKLRHLLDPYGEANSQAFEICYYEILDSETKEIYINALKNGRIIGEPVINDDQATIEIAVGSQSNSLEKVVLVNRDGSWYILRA